MKRKIAALFKDLCCSKCKSDFDENSVVIMRKEQDQDGEMLIFRMVCRKCGKSFGVAFLGLCDLDIKNYNEDDLVLKVQEGPEPINADDVLDAHEFIKSMDTTWQKYIADMDA